MFKRWIVSVVSVALLNPSFAMASEGDSACTPVKTRVSYRVQLGDKLGDICRTFGLKPLWGSRRGLVGKVAKFNKIVNPDLIYPGDLIDLPFRCEEDMARYELSEARDQLDRVEGLHREIEPRHLVRLRTYTRRKNEFALNDDADGLTANSEIRRTPSAEVTEALNQGVDVEAWVWLGIGANYQLYQQSVPVLGTARFQNITSPTWFLRGGFEAAKQFGLDFSYKETPGRMESSDTVQVTNPSYVWKTISTEVTYRAHSDSNWRFHLGFQHHLMPFMYRDPFAAVIDVRTNSLTMFTLGFDRRVPVARRFYFEWLMHYQFPILASTSLGADFSVVPKLTFDGSLGGVIRLGRQSRLGLFWYGQWHQYRFEYSSLSSISGDQMLFYSNLELRYGFEF